MCVTICGRFDVRQASFFRKRVPVRLKSIWHNTIMTYITGLSGIRYGKALAKGEQGLHTYEYDSNVYFRKITVTAGFCAFIFLYSIFQFVTGENPLLWVGAAVVS